MGNFVHLVLSRFNVQVFEETQPCSDSCTSKRFNI